jgi:hypothetical protein
MRKRGGSSSRSCCVSSGDAAAIARAEALLGGAAAPTPSPSPEPEAVAAPPAPAAPDTLADIREEGVDAPDEGAGAEELASAAPAEELDLDLDVGEPDLQLDLETESEPQASIGSDEEFEEPAPEATAIADTVDGEPLEFDRLEIEEDGPPADGGETFDLDDVDEPEEILDLTDALGEFSSARLDEPSWRRGGWKRFASSPTTRIRWRPSSIWPAPTWTWATATGARGILEEVASAGSAEQQKEARDLLERIA